LKATRRPKCDCGVNFDSPRLSGCPDQVVEINSDLIAPLSGFKNGNWV